MVEPGTTSSTGKHCWALEVAANKSASVVPAFTRATRSSLSCSTTPANCERSMTSRADSGGLPQSSLVPAPRATTLSPWVAATRMARATSSVWRGWTTMSGTTPSTESPGSPSRAPPGHARCNSASAVVKTTPPSLAPEAGGRPGEDGVVRRTTAVWGRLCRGCICRLGRTRSGPKAWSAGRRR